MSAPVLETRDLTIRFGGHVAVNAVTTGFRAGELTAIVGPNGAGKTTYFNLISGQLPATSGQIFLDGEEITSLPPSARAQKGIGRAFQITSLFPNLTVHENVRLAVQAPSRHAANLWSLWSSHREWIERAERALEELNLHTQRDTLAAALPHGDKRKLEVAIMIGTGPATARYQAERFSRICFRRRFDEDCARSASATRASPPNRSAPSS